MSIDFDFTIQSLRFDEHYHPSSSTRATTNFANLARGDSRKDNLRNALQMIDNRFNALAHWDNPTGDRYAVSVDIISVEMKINSNGGSDAFPIIEMLKTTVIDRTTSTNIEGVVGNSFSSYVRDYDFSVVLPEHNRNSTQFTLPDGFGELHGNLFKSVLKSEAYRSLFSNQPIICLSVSTTKTYHRTANFHPILGIEYRQEEYSYTDEYFKKMGLQVRYFMPPNGVAPLAFYYTGDLLADYSNLELISTISLMETFQKIYRPEIYNANSPAGAVYIPSLSHSDYSLTRVIYDREERSQLAVAQGKFTQDHFIKPYQRDLERWSSSYAA